MADQVQRRGGTEAENDAFTGAAREITVDTTNNTLRVHDGAKQGGFPVLGESQLKNVADYTALKALTADDYVQVFVRQRAANGDGGDGVFLWRSGDQSANVTNDPGEWEWVPPDGDATGASGAWERLTYGTLASDRTVTIPTDYATLQDAIDSQSKWPVEQGVQITLNIAAGHNPTAGLLLEHGDFRHFVITSDDATVSLDATFPATDVIKCLNAHGPELNCLIDANGQGDTSGAGVWLEDRSSMRINNGAGVQNSVGRGLYVNNSRAYAAGANFDGSAGRALWVTRGSIVHAESFRARNAATGTGGVDNTVLVYASRGSTILLNEADLINSQATEAIIFSTRSRIVAELTDCSNNDALYTARARNTGILSVRGITVNTGRRVARADENSTVNAEEATFSSLTQSSDAFGVAQGSRMFVDNTNTNVTEANISTIDRFNELTPQGVIHHGDVEYAITHVIAKNDHVINNQGSYVTDNELSVTLEANSVYEIELRAFFQQANGADPPNGWACNFTTPTGATGNKVAAPWDANSALGTNGITNAVTLASTSTDPRAVTITGYVVTGGTAGALVFRWRQNTADATDSTRLKGSSLRAWKA